MSVAQEGEDLYENAPHPNLLPEGEGTFNIMFYQLEITFLTFENDLEKQYFKLKNGGRHEQRPAYREN